MHRPNKLIRFLTGLALLLLPASAQDAPMVKVELLTVALENSDEVLFYANKNEISEFTSNRAGLSYPFGYEGPRRFILHRNKADFETPEGGETCATGRLRGSARGCEASPSRDRTGRERETAAAAV